MLFVRSDMDKLKAEILSKRKARAQEDARPSKYMRRGDLEKLKEAGKERTKSPSEARSSVMRSTVWLLAANSYRLFPP